MKVSVLFTAAQKVSHYSEALDVSSTVQKKVFRVFSNMDVELASSTQPNVASAITALDTDSPDEIKVRDGS